LCFPSAKSPPVSLPTHLMHLCILLLLRTAAGSWLTRHGCERSKAGLHPWPPNVPCSPGTAGLSPTSRHTALGPYPAYEWNLSTDPDPPDPSQQLLSNSSNSEGFFKRNKTSITPDPAGAIEPKKPVSQTPSPVESRPKHRKGPTAKTACRRSNHFRWCTCAPTPETKKN